MIKKWIEAARPRTLPTSVSPVIAASAYAWYQNTFNGYAAAICLIFALLAQIASNFGNDYFGYKKGRDNSDRVGPRRAVASGDISPISMLLATILTLSLACVTGCLLIPIGGWKLLIAGIFIAIFAIAYSAGPYPLSYNGWGDVLVIIFFGFVPVGGTYYVQALTWTPDVTVASLVCGLLIDTLLVVNNYRDREADARSGKQTIIVRFGEKFGRYFYLALGITASLLCLRFLSEGHFYAGLLPQLYLIPHFFTWKKMVRIYNGKKLNNILGETSRNMLLMGVLLSLGLLLG